MSKGLGLYQQSSETPANTLLILVISGWPRVWIQSKHVCGRRWGGRGGGAGGRGYTGLFRLYHFFLTAKAKARTVEPQLSVLICGELKPHGQTMTWYQLSKQISIALHQLEGNAVCLWGIGDWRIAKKSRKKPMPVTTIVQTQQTKTINTLLFFFFFLLFFLSASASSRIYGFVTGIKT